MALDPDDPRPGGISLRKAYSAIRKWYQKNIGLPEQRGGNSAGGSAALIRALPPSKQLSRLELRAVLTEVISGHLEWGYHHSDGRFKMGAYAHAALDAAGLPHNLTEREQDKLQTSRLRRFFLFNRGRVEAGGAGPGRPLLVAECPASDCPFRTARLPGPRADAPVLLDFMSVGGGRHRKAPKRQFLDLVRRVHKGIRAREVILTDPYIYSDAAEDGTGGGYDNLVDYLRTLKLDQNSDFTLRLNPSPRKASQADKVGLERAVKAAFPKARIATFSARSSFHDRFYLVRDTSGQLSGIFGPSLNGLGSDSIVLMGALEYMNTLDRLRALFN